MNLKEIEKKIRRIKKSILEINQMRPGSLSEQYSVCGKENCRCRDKKNPQKHGPYYKLKYVHQGKQKNQFIRAPFAEEIKKELEQYKKFKELTQRWIALEIESSNLKMKSKIEKKEPEK